MHGLCRAATPSPEPKLETHSNHERPRPQRRKPPLRTALGVLVGLLQGFLQPYAMVGLDSGGGIRTRDLRVMRCRTGGQVGPSCRSLREICGVREGWLLSNWNHIGTTETLWSALA